jgi:hypothetical protein
MISTARCSTQPMNCSTLASEMPCPRGVASKWLCQRKVSYPDSGSEVEGGAGVAPGW